MRMSPACPRTVTNLGPKGPARLNHEGSQRGCADGPYDGHPRGREPETVLDTRSQGHEDARQKAKVHGCSRGFVNGAG